MSRQTEPGGAAAGIGASLRLDPGHLPTRYTAPDRGADTGQRAIDLHADRVVIRRTASGARMKLQLPVRIYRGVVVRIAEDGRPGPDRVEIVLVHADPALDVPLYSSLDADDVVAVWQRWGSALALPLLITGEDGAVREAFPRMGAVLVGQPGPRRRRRSALKSRRPQAMMRRKPGGPISGQSIHREREIIARN
ncbi:DUF6101 family protein [Phreatobacter sp.]|uniref:DUF6101 family protein n=1 Tax=Phreatobacter sp. TaxID=1966341 RepID=UPI003F71912D